jgi:hypothetical protein
VGEIEDPDGRTNREMLGPNPPILDRHVPAAEVHHAGSGGEMAAMKGGPEERSSCRDFTCHTGAS